MKRAENVAVSRRLDYLDAARGLAVFLMIFVNFVEQYTGIPAWTRHAQGDGFTYVDGIVPCSHQGGQRTGPRVDSGLGGHSPRPWGGGRLYRHRLAFGQSPCVHQAITGRYAANNNWYDTNLHLFWGCSIEYF